MSAPSPLPRAFFERPVVELAEALLGQWLVRRGRGGTLAVLRIVETEAYGGHGVDESAHSFRGPTRRCAVMFGPAGHAYVYATQGLCFCLNVVAEGGRDGRAVLLRAGEPLAGAALMRRRRLARLAEGPTRRRLQSGRDHELAAGPGRLCLCLDIDRRLDGLDFTDPGSPLHLAAPDAAVAVPQVRWTTRIGLNPASASFGWRWRAVDVASPAISSGPGRRPRYWRVPHPERCPERPT